MRKKINPAIALSKPGQFPRASAYDTAWILENEMGPNGLWLMEWLTSEHLVIRPGMKVLDLACGKAMSSIFLAKEYGVQVWAVDLMVPAAENQQRIVAAGVSDKVTALQADATKLPFEARFFDVALCVDALEYFGTTKSYLPYLAQFVKPGGQIGAVNAGLKRELNGKIPEYLQPYWLPEFNSFHSDAWWRKLWEESGAVKVNVADSMPRSGALWLEWETIISRTLPGSPEKETLSSLNLLRADKSRNLVFNRIVGTVK